jgi:hypothetical protein
VCGLVGWRAGGWWLVSWRLAGSRVTHKPLPTSHQPLPDDSRSGAMIYIFGKDT